MKHKLFFLFLLAVVNLNAQLALQDSLRIDSLKYIIANSADDKEILSAYNEWELLIYAFDKDLDATILTETIAICDKNLKNSELNKNELNYYSKVKADALYYLGDLKRAIGQLELAVSLYNDAINIYEKNADSVGIAKAINNQGLAYSELGNHAQSLDNHSISIQLFQELQDSAGWARGLNNSAISAANIGDYDLSIQYLMQSLAIYKNNKDDYGIATSFNNIGMIYQQQDDLDKALTYYQNSYEIYVAQDNLDRQANSLSNMASLYVEKGQTDLALEQYHQAKKICEEIGNQKNLAEALIGIGEVYILLENYERAYEYLYPALEISSQLEYSHLISTNYVSLGQAYAGLGNYKKAIDYGEQGLSLAHNIGSLSLIKRAAKNLYEWNKVTNNLRQALEMHELYIVMRDSIFREENQREIVNQEYKYQYEQQKVLDQAEFEKEKLIEKERTDNLLLLKKEKEQTQNVIIYAISAGSLLLVVFLIVIFSRLNVTKKQNVEIESQKLEIDLQHDELEESHNEIRDSINYAKYLQAAILPDFTEIESYLANYFILFKPKDVISGDFYWFEHLNGVNYIAAADCTGHGVPGAMLCIVCSNALNRAVNEYDLTAPNLILDKTREIVIETLGKKEGHIRDGMDISFVALKPDSVAFAGANNPLWIVREQQFLTKTEREQKGTIVDDDYGLIEFKGNKQPIGRYHHMTPFTQVTVALKKGDRLYLFSDGYVDQFGGDLGKKFKSKSLKKMLLSSAKLPVLEQQKTLADTFDEWKGEVDQVDDVCVIGIEV